MIGTILVIFFALSVSIYGISALEFTDCGSKLGQFTKIQVSDCVTSRERCMLKRQTNVTMSINFNLTSVDQCANVSVVVEASIMGYEFEFDTPHLAPNTNACINNGLSCPLIKGSNYEYVVTLPIIRGYPKIKADVRWKLVDENKDVIVCVGIPVEIYSDQKRG